MLQAGVWSKLLAGAQYGQDQVFSDEPGAPSKQEILCLTVYCIPPYLHLERHWANLPALGFVKNQTSASKW